MQDEHEQLAARRARHPEWIWPRSDTHVFLGVPGSLEGLKTVVEPGNSFSPGPSSYGVSTWVFHRGDRALYAPERMDLAALRWEFAEGHLPVLLSTWEAGDLTVRSRLYTDGDLEWAAVNDYYAVTVENPTAHPVECSLYLVLRSCGPAGGPVRQLGLTPDGAVSVNGYPSVLPSAAPDAFGAVSYAERAEDISVWVQRGELPPTAEVEDDSTWASGALEYRLSLAPGQARSVFLTVRVRAEHRLLRALFPPPADKPADEEAFLERWRRLSPIQLEVPDPRFREAFFAQLTHLYMFTVGDAPRISPVSYPLWWLRDGAYIVHALDKGGLHDWAEQACRGVAGRVSFGGFGSEGDGPGDLIWMLTEHYLLTRDEGYLRDLYPHLRAGAELLMRMRRATAPLHHATEHVVPQYAFDPTLDILCAPAKDGLIQARMDWHLPVFWINSFAYLALRRVAECARILGEAGAEEYEAEAEAVREALLAAAPRSFGQNDRDVNSALWPGGWALADGTCPPVIRAAYDRFWVTVRCPGGQYTPEPLWTYFEAGQAHNYLYLGDRERTWQTIEHFLTHQTAPGLYTYHEGNGDENSFGLWQQVRGWDRIRYVTPHGWTAAEVFLLLRDCLAYEDGGRLILGAGVPEEWMSQEQPFGVTDLPTHFGRVSWSYDPPSGELSVEVEHPPAGGVVVALPGWEVRGGG